MMPETHWAMRTAMRYPIYLSEWCCGDANSCCFKISFSLLIIGLFSVPSILYAIKPLDVDAHHAMLTIICGWYVCCASVWRKALHRQIILSSFG
jgi:hypothetical protein